MLKKVLNAGACYPKLIKECVAVLLIGCYILNVGKDVIDIVLHIYAHVLKLIWFMMEK